MKKLMVVLLLVVTAMLGMGGTALARRDTLGYCKLCNCDRYRQGPKKSVCICGHSKGAHALVEVE
jgi:hypothetical protein